MNNAKLIERIVPIAAVALSLIATALQPLMATASPGLMRWISIAGYAIQPWVLFVISIICAGIFSLSARKSIGSLKLPALVCSAIVACLSIAVSVVSLSCLLAE